MILTEKTPGAEAPGVSREETLPNEGSVLVTSAEPIGAGKQGLGGKLRIGFDTGIRAVETELLFLFADPNANGHLQDHPDRGRSG